jgi:hypothetical protein
MLKRKYCNALVKTYQLKIKAMKKILFSLAAAFIVAVGIAQTNSEGNVSKKVLLAQNPASLVINGSISVVLLNGNTKEIWMEGSKEAIDGYSVKEKNATVEINDRAGKSRTEALLYVPAQAINTLFINGASAVTSYETLLNQKIDVYVNGSCKVWVRTTGIIHVNAADGYDYTYSTKKINAASR